MSRGSSEGSGARVFPHRSRVGPGGVVFTTARHVVTYLGADGSGSVFQFAVETRGGTADEVTTANLTAIAGETLLLPWVRDALSPLMLTVEGGIAEMREVRTIVTRASPNLSALLDTAVTIAGRDAKEAIAATAPDLAETDRPAEIGDAVAVGATVRTGDGIEVGPGDPPEDREDPRKGGRRRKKNRRRERGEEAEGGPGDSPAPPGCHGGCPSGSVATPRGVKLHPNGPDVAPDGTVIVQVDRKSRRLIRLALGRLTATIAEDPYSADRVATNLGVCACGDPLPQVSAMIANLCVDFPP